MSYPPIVLPSAVTVDRAQPGTIDSADDLLAAQIPAGTGDVPFAVELR